MLKTILFQLHWLLGITAGTVLALMGITGACISFEDELLRALNPSLAQVAKQHAAGDTPLALTELAARLPHADGQPFTRLRVDATGMRPSTARFAGGQESVYFDPYSGEQFTALRGQGFFDLAEDLHRRLAYGDRGRAITGACAIILVFFCLSGLYLRWPRQWWHWRTWLAVEWRRTGRSFLWSLHSVVGTWVLLVYLLLVLTGLWWSYGWYRDGVTRLLGGPDAGQQATPTSGAEFNLARVQDGLYSIDGLRRGYVDLRPSSKPDAPVTARIHTGNPAHDRAYDVVQLDPGSGEILKHERYSEMSAGRKVIGSMFALHSGSFFGIPGRIIVMLSSAAMVVFFITGWMLYLNRRRSQRQARASRVSLDTASSAGGEPWLVSFASQSGTAEQLAWHAAGQLQAAGLPVQVQPLHRLDGTLLGSTRKALFVVSTFGDGEPPDAARPFEKRMLAQRHGLGGLHYAVLALGDRQYARFCGFSRRIEGWLTEQGATALFPSIEADASDQTCTAMQRWQQHLAGITGRAVQAPVAHEAGLAAWPLVSRTLMNPGSVGGEIWRIRLQPPPNTAWQAGDILHVLPRNDPAWVQGWLQRLQRDGEESVQVEGHAMLLADALATRSLPQLDVQPTPHDLAVWLAELPQLPQREYSIASIPADGVVELVVRLSVLEDGHLGLGSGWLCRHAPAGAPVQARVRRNAGFHRDAESPAPMILIGNGTGIAGLRALLRDAHAQGQHGHWLVFGERNAAHDHVLADEIGKWQADGHLARVDLAFSRDQVERVYVQDRLREAAAPLREWVAAGATVYVCGSLQGMAGGVDAALREVLGERTMDALMEAGRYRRDVY